MQEKTEELETLKRYYNFNYENLKHLQDKLESCPVSGEVVAKLKGNYHTFFKARVKHPDYFDETDRKAEELREENTRLLQQVAQQKSENEVLHRKVNDLGNKYRQACRECDELAQKLRIAEEDDKKHGLLIETLNQLFDEKR